MTRQDTTRLVDAAKAGDKAAFSQLVEFHYAMVYGVHEPSARRNG